MWCILYYYRWYNFDNRPSSVLSSTWYQLLLQEGSCLICFNILHIISLVSYQSCYYLFYHEMHLIRFICCYCTLIQNKSIIFSIFYLKPSRDLISFTNSKSFLFWYNQTQFLCWRQINPKPSCFDHPQRSATTESCSSIRCQMILVREIFTEI